MQKVITIRGKHKLDLSKKKKKKRYAYQDTIFVKYLSEEATQIKNLYNSLEKCNHKQKSGGVEDKLFVKTLYNTDLPQQKIFNGQ